MNSMDNGQTRAMDADTAQHVYAILYGHLSLCGCGNPETAFELVRDILALVPFYEDNRWEKVDELVGSPGGAHIVLSVLDEGGVINHGGSLVGAWLTDKGKYLLRALQEVDIQELDELIDRVGFPHDGKDCTDACWAEEADRG